MAKMTLLQIVQNILSAMDSDVVDAIDDTEESLQVVSIVEETYHELMSRKDWNHLKLPIPLSNLDPVIQDDHPTTLVIPESVFSIESVRYDVRSDPVGDLEFQVIKYMDPVNFLDMCLHRKSSDTAVESVPVVGSPAQVLVYNDRWPKYWTSFDDQHVTFDAYHRDTEDHLPEERSVVYATILPAFDKEDDDFVPELPARMFPMFVAECKKACFFYLKESQTPIDQQRALRGASVFNDRGSRAHERKTRVRYGRR